jgi:hypothetical protein
MKKSIFLMALSFVFYSYTYAQYTAIPDTVFEQRLITDGIDSEGTLDGQILTADANAVTGNLNVLGDDVTLGIQDLTGIEAFINISSLEVSYNQNLTTGMDLTNNTLLTSVEGKGCRLLTSVNVTGLTNLSSMSFANAGLTSLDVSTNSALTYLNLRNNHVSILDLSQNHVINTVELKNAGLTYLDLRNGNQANMIHFDSDLNHNLSCIFFDDASVIIREEHAVWFFDNYETSPCLLVSNEAECSSCLLTLSTNEVAETPYNMYPNPVNGLLHITTKSPHAIVSICSITGKVILTKNLTENDNLIDVSGLASGLYLARFSSDNQVDTKKLMIR